MKIVFLGKYNQSEILTGPEKVAKRIFHEVSKSAPSCLFIEYFFKRERRSNLWLRLFGKEIVDQDGSVMRLGMIRLIFFLLAYQPDIIHVITFERFILPLFLSKFFFKGKIVVTIHGLVKHEKKIPHAKESLYSKFKDMALEALIMRYSNSLIFVSELELSLARLYYEIDETKIHIIPNGIDERFSSPYKKRFSGSSLKVVLYEREMLGANKTEELIRILSPCNSRSFSLYIINERDTNKHDEGCLKVFRVHKMQTEELCSFLADKHLYINNAIYDTFSLMTIECMAAGVVPIVANTVGMKTFIRNGGNGFVYKSDKPEAIKDIIEGIDSGKYNLQTLSENAKKIYDELNWNTIGLKYQEIYLR
jgi:glycosyltransferase involved in cell wall biosynthesis